MYGGCGWRATGSPAQTQFAPEWSRRSLLEGAREGGDLHVDRGRRGFLLLGDGLLLGLVLGEQRDHLRGAPARGSFLDLGEGGRLARNERTNLRPHVALGIGSLSGGGGG